MTMLSKPLDGKLCKDMSCRQRRKQIRLIKDQLKPMPAALEKWAAKQYNACACVRLSRRCGGLQLRMGLVWCSKCGGELEVTPNIRQVKMANVPDVCPHCGAKLTDKIKTDLNEMNEKEYVHVLERCGDWEVVRTYEIRLRTEFGKDTELKAAEVIRHWVSSRGEVECESVSSSCSSNFYSASVNWIWGTEMKFRDEERRRYGYLPYKYRYNGRMYPRMTLTPELERRGFRLYKRYGDATEYVWQLLRNGYVEKYLKMGQISVMEDILRGGYSHYTWRDQIRIANHAGYKIKDFRLWADTLDLMQTETHFDLHNPKYLCMEPKEMRALHDRLVAKRIGRQSLEKKMKELKSAAAKEKLYKKVKGQYLGIVFDDGTRFAHVMQSCKEHVEEGIAMHHCVGGYYTHMDCLILGIRDKDGTRKATVELMIRDWNIAQIKGPCNKIPKDADMIKELIQANVWQFEAAKQKVTKKKQAV